MCGIHEKHRNKVFYYNVDNIDGIARARFVFVLCVWVSVLIYTYGMQKNYLLASMHGEMLERKVAA